MRPVTEIYNDIINEWSKLTPNSLGDLLAPPRLPMVEFGRVEQALHPILDRFSFVKEIVLAERLDGLSILAFTKDDHAGWVLGLYLLSICEVLQENVDIDYITFTFAFFITGTHFSEVYQGLTTAQRRLLIEVAEHFLIKAKADVIQGMTALKEEIPKISELIEIWKNK